MKNPRTIAIVVGALALLVVGFLFFKSPKPIIEIKAETLTTFGPDISLGPIALLPFPLVNTYVTSLTVVVVLIVLAFLATRKLELIPSGLQNAAEAVIEAFYTIVINTAGEKNGRRFFPVIMTIFTFIWIANWMALLPFFNAIGTVEKVDAAHFHKEAVVFSKNAGLRLINPNQTALEFEVDKAKCSSYDPLTNKAGDAQAQYDDCILHERERAFAIQLPKAAGIKVDTSACKSLATAAQAGCVEEVKLALAPQAQARLAADDKQIGVLIPFFRSMNTDLNSPLSIAIWAMIFIEFWGVTTLGAFKYAGKFLNFSNPIAFFVGFLEFIAELARLISFTFRLFGNMLAGEILLLVMTFLLPFLVALPFYALEVFVGLIQAFVFAMLTLVFGVLAVSAHDDHEDHGLDEPGPVHIDNIPAGIEPAH